MSLTRRGWGAVVLAVGGTLLGIMYGPRSLNAVVAPLVVALVAAHVHLWRVERPRLRRTVGGDGFVGERRTIELYFDTGEPLSVRIHDRLDDGLRAVGDEPDTTIDGSEPVTYDVEFTGRGERSFGPLHLDVHDVLGLLSRTYEYTGTDELLVYPRVFELTGGTRQELDYLVEDAFRHNREEFDRLREYDRSDSLRDVHWKSSAKRPQSDLVVKEFVAEEDLGSVHVLAESDGDGRAADEMAEAAASIALYLLDAGVDVAVSAPGGTLAPDTGSKHRRSILELLARTPGGGVRRPESADAEVRVYGHDDGATIDVGGRETNFDTLVGAERQRDRLPSVDAQEVSA